MILFSGQTVDGSSADFRYVGDNANGMINLTIDGTLGGGTVAVEAKTPLGNYVPIPDGSFTTTGLYVIQAASFVGRVTLTGATTPNASVWLDGDARQLSEAVVPA